MKKGHPPVTPSLESGNLALILGQLDITLSTLRDAITAVSPNNKTLNDLYGRLEALLIELQQKTEPADTQYTFLDVIYVALKQIVNCLTRPLWVDPATSRMKADVVISSGTVTTVTTASTLTNLGTANVSGMYIDRTAWGQTIRPRIT